MVAESSATALPAAMLSCEKGAIYVKFIPEVFTHFSVITMAPRDGWDA
jgi:hypothetical protein